MASHRQDRTISHPDPLQQHPLHGTSAPSHHLHEQESSDELFSHEERPHSSSRTSSHRDTHPFVLDRPHPLHGLDTAAPGGYDSLSYYEDDFDVRAKHHDPKTADAWKKRSSLDPSSFFRKGRPRSNSSSGSERTSLPVADRHRLKNSHGPLGGLGRRRPSSSASSIAEPSPPSDDEGDHHDRHTFLPGPPSSEDEQSSRPPALSRRSSARPRSSQAASRRGSNTSRSQQSTSRVRKHAVSAAGATRAKRLSMPTLVFTALFVLAIGLSLDNSTSNQYQSYATSSFDGHADLGIILTAQNIALAVYRPFITKEANVIGLWWAFLISFVLYQAGYALLAASQNISMYAIGSVVSQFGVAAFSALPMVAYVVFSKSLRNNTFLNALGMAPYLLTGIIGSFMVEGVMSTLTWRWGYGLFNIIMTVCAVPLLFLLWKDKRGENLAAQGQVAKPTERRYPGRIHHQLRDGHLGQIDFLGLLFLLLALAGMLMPWTLIGNSIRWSSPLFYGPLIAGGVCVVALFLIEWDKHNHFPLFPREVFRMRAVMCALGATAFNMMSFSLLLTWQYSFMHTRAPLDFLGAVLTSSAQVLYPTWSALQLGLFNFAETFALCLLPFALSIPVKKLEDKQKEAYEKRKLFTKEGKGLLRQAMWWTVGGHAVRVAAVVCMIFGREVNGPLGLLIAAQFIHGFGGSITSTFIHKVSIASVSDKADQSMASALNILEGDIGTAIGSAVATIVWRKLLPQHLDANVGTLLSASEIDEVFESATKAASYPLDSDTSLGIRTAYAEVMRILLWIALGLAITSTALSLAMGPTRIYAIPRAPGAPASVHGSELGRAADPEEAVVMEEILRQPSVAHALGHGHGHRKRRGAAERYARRAREPLARRTGWGSEEEWSV